MYRFARSPRSFVLAGGKAYAAVWCREFRELADPVSCFDADHAKLLDLHSSELIVFEAGWFVICRFLRQRFRKETQTEKQDWSLVSTARSKLSDQNCPKAASTQSAWLDRLLILLTNPNSNEDQPVTKNNDAADQPSNDAEETKIHAEEVKDKHTTHWDMDYLPTEELEKAHREGRESSDDDDDTK